MKRHNVADAIAAFYDAFVSAMQSRVLEYKQETPDLDDERRLFDTLREKNIITKFEVEDFRKLQQLLEMAFSQSISQEEFSSFSNQYETVMYELGVLPIKEDELPDEQSVTL
ncbi:MAG: hypothetical protein GF411_15950 [Candidatus Lokiarchaeota archaeon]|nr:hypothetical protein [Candidatus Lokiarchaeota archaeon]